MFKVLNISSAIILLLASLSLGAMKINEDSSLNLVKQNTTEQFYKDKQGFPIDRFLELQQSNSPQSVELLKELFPNLAKKDFKLTAKIAKGSFKLFSSGLDCCQC